MARTILVVEDDLDTQLMMKMLLEYTGSMWQPLGMDETRWLKRTVRSPS